MSIRPCEQLIQGRKGPCRDHVGARRRRHLNALHHQRGRPLQPHFPPCFPEEGRFPRIRFDQGDQEIRAQGRNDEAGKSATASQVGERLGIRRDQGNHLGGIDHVALPRPLQGIASDKVDGLLPSIQGLDQNLQAPECFT